MDRGRSHSRSKSGDIRRASPSPHGTFDTSGLGLQPTTDASNTFSSTTTAGQQSASYLASSQSQQFASQQALDQSFLQSSAGFAQPSPQFGPQSTPGNHFSSAPFDANNPANSDFSLFGDSSLGASQAIDPSFLSNTLDPQLLDSQPQSQSVNPSELMHQMATSQAQSPTPPHLLPGMMSHPYQHQQHTPSPHASPNMNQGAFPSPAHSRHASLDPNAAYQVQNNNEWASMSQFRGHRRTPSETHSDISSQHASPYMGNNDSFDNENPSPLLNAQDPSLFQEVMQFGQFNLNDAQSHISPGHSPHISPRLMPQQQALPHFQPGSFGLDPTLNNYQQQMGAYQNQGQEPFPTINQGSAPDFGQADTMSPPEISIEFAPPSRQASFEPPKPEHQTDALSPPDRCKSTIVSYARMLIVRSSESQ
jgi:hypothetical protein